MKIVDIDEAQNSLAELIELAEQGEHVVISDHDQPKVKLVPVQPERTGQRIFGQYRGLIQISEDFDEPLRDHFWLAGNP